MDFRVERKIAVQVFLCHGSNTSPRSTSVQNLSNSQRSAHHHLLLKHQSPNMLLSGTLLLLHSLLIVASPVEERTDVCQSGLYGELVPILKPFIPAQAYCAQAYPAKCSAQTKLKARGVSVVFTTSKTSTTLVAPNATPKSSTSLSKTTTKAVNPKESALVKLLQQGRGVISTLCSCIQDKKVGEEK